jgi:hypothetical protein
MNVEGAGVAPSCLGRRSGRRRLRSSRPVGPSPRTASSGSRKQLDAAEMAKLSWLSPVATEIFVGVTTRRGSVSGQDDRRAPGEPAARRVGARRVGLAGDPPVGEGARERGRKRSCAG